MGSATPRAERIAELAVRLLAQRDRTEAQLRTALSRKGGSATAIDRAVRHLRRRGYIDDLAFARRWARGRMTRRPMGRTRLEAELLQQGLRQTTVRQVLQQVFEVASEEELARNLLAQRAGRQPQSLSQRARLLRSYGFSEDTIEGVMGEE